MEQPWIVCHIVGEKLDEICFFSDQPSRQQLQRERPLHVECLTVDERTLLLWHDFERSWKDIMSALTYADRVMLLQQGTRADPRDLTDWLEERVDPTQDSLLFTLYRRDIPAERISAEERKNIGGAKLGYTKRDSALERGPDFPRHAHRSCTVTLLVHDMELV